MTNSQNGRSAYASALLDSTISVGSSLPDQSDGTLTLVGLGGSLRPGSLSEAALMAALALWAERGARPLAAAIRDLRLPLFDPEWRAAPLPAGVQRLLDSVRTANAFVLCSPTYHGTLSGAVKNALDWLHPLGSEDPPYFAGRPVGLVALGGGAGANVLTALGHAARALRGTLVPTAVVVPGEAVDPAIGAILDVAVARRLAAMVDELLDLAARFAAPVPGRASAAS